MWVTVVHLVGFTLAFPGCCGRTFLNRIFSFYLYQKEFVVIAQVRLVKWEREMLQAKGKSGEGIYENPDYVISFDFFFLLISILYPSCPRKYVSLLIY